MPESDGQIEGGHFIGDEFGFPIFNLSSQVQYVQRIRYKYIQIFHLHVPISFLVIDASLLGRYIFSAHKGPAVKTKMYSSKGLLCNILQRAQ